MSAPDIVFPVRIGDHNPELRYALRSLANVPHGQVWLAGHMPGWVQNCRHLPIEQTSTKHRNSLCNLIGACESPDVSEDFVLWNDDIFLLEPLDQIPVLHRGTIRRYLAMSRSLGNSTYIRGTKATLELLEQSGYRDPLSYELHVPLPMTKSGVLEACRLIEEARVPELTAIQMRSMYGNLASIGGKQAEDVKVFGTRLPEIVGAFLSTSDAIWPKQPAALMIQRILAKPGPYEEAS